MTLPPLFLHDNMRMKTPNYTKHYLDRLSDHELLTLAEEHGLDIPQELERVFIIDELLYLDRQDNGTSAEFENHLPNLNHGTYSIIDVLIRDPLWVFVFWEIGENDQIVIDNDNDFEGYCLRVIPFKENSEQPDMAGSFTVALEKNDTARYLGFQPDDRRLFTIELCVPRPDNYTVLAVSRSFRMPQLLKPQQDEEMSQNPMIQLSGACHIPYIRTIDRQIRPRGE